MIIAFIGGIVLGFVFFGGLQLSIHLLDKVRYAGLLMIASLFLRMGILLVGFYFLMDGSFLNLLMALIGVILVRLILIWRLSKK